MKAYITNGPRAGEVVEIAPSARDVVLIDPINPEPLTFDETPRESVHIHPRHYVRGTVTRDVEAYLRLHHGASCIIYDPDVKTREDREHALREAERKRMESLDPVERMAIEIEKSGAHDHRHCWSCDEDGEYPCCRALEDAQTWIESRDKTPS